MSVIVGVDPGARSTGVVVIDTAADDRHGNRALPRLLARCTVLRDPAEPMLEVSDLYLGDVLGIIRDATNGALGRDAGGLDPLRVDVIAVERVTAPTGFAGGKRHTLDPAPIMATCVVLGAIIGRAWAPAELVTVRAGARGQGPAAAYPPELLDRGGRVAPAGKRRHERSAYDVARAAPARLALARRLGTLYP